MQAGCVLLLLGGVARAARHGRKFVRMRYFLDIGVAGGTVDSGVGGCFQGCGIVPGGHAGLPPAGTRPGIVTPGAVFRFERGCLLASESGSEGQGERGEAKGVAS